MVDKLTTCAYLVIMASRAATARRSSEAVDAARSTETTDDLAALDASFDDILSAGPPSDPKERKRRRIIAAATELFVHHGYRKTSVDEIAHRARVALADRPDHRAIAPQVELLVVDLGQRDVDAVEMPGFDQR